MNRRRYLAAVAAGAATALSGCTSGDGGSQPTTETTTAPMDTTTAADTTTESGTTATGDVTVAVGSTEEYGDVLVDSEGMSLYLFTQDDGSTSVCYDGCAENWPPLTVEGEPMAGDGVTAELGTTERDDGSMQVTADGKPLYYFAGDESAGETNGQGLNDAWYLLAPGGSQIGGTATTDVAVGSTDEYGDVLVDSEGMSLYLFTQDEGGESACSGDCAENWPPLTVEGEPMAGDGVTAELGTTERDDGSMQVTASGMPLYYFAGDESAGDTNGQGVGDVWYLLGPDGSQIGGTSTTTTESGGGGTGPGY